MEAIEKILLKYAELISTNYKEKLSTIRASGILEDTQEFEIQNDGNEYSIVLKLEDYWKYIEEGRPAGTWPPVGKIIDWIKIKPIEPKPYQLPDGGYRIPTEKQLAYLIGRKIFNDGIEPKPFLEEVLSELQSEIIQELQNALRKDIFESLKIDFKDFNKK